MAYFNKNDFWALIRLWRRVCSDSKEEVVQRSLLREDEWLMQNFLPIRFISDIRKELHEKGVI